jgi:hypothetical protein
LLLPGNFGTQTELQVLEMGMSGSTYLITSWYTNPYGYRLCIAGDFKRFAVKIIRGKYLVPFKIAF